MKITKGTLLVAFAAALPLSVFVTDIFIIFIAIAWVIEGKFNQKWQQLKSSRWMLSLIFLFLLYAVGMLWGANNYGLIWLLQRTALILFIPILYTAGFSDKQLKQSVIAYLSSVTFSAIIALLINLGWIKHLFKYSSLFTKNWSVSAFMAYTDHNILMALSILIGLILILRIPNKTNRKYIVAVSVIICAMSLFTEKGRAGQLAFLISTGLFSIVLLRQKKQLLLFSFLFIVSIPLISYYSSNTFNNRINTTISELKHLDRTNTNSLNTRYYLSVYTFEKIKEKPIVGYGTGNFVSEFSAISPHANQILNDVHKTPHNNYLFVMFELGILGLSVFLSVFYFQIMEYVRKPIGKIRIIFPIVFMSIMLFDSYFYNHNPAVLYAYLSVVFARYSFR